MYSDPTEILGDARVTMVRDEADTGANESGRWGDGASYDLERVRRLVARLLEEGYQRAYGRASDARGPLGGLIRPGDSVLLKPNWVSDRNRSGQGIDCLVTGGAVVEAVIEQALRAGASKVVVGDAPIQSCKLAELMTASGCDAAKTRFAAAGAPVEWRDFRRTIRSEGNSTAEVRKNVQPLDDFILFDLGTDSLLEPISGDAHKFRVTMYDPDLMRRTHAAGRHQYLISRHVMAADVVINLPKLKTHKKAGVTGALKNLVGINGNKEYLPHHRIGGSRTGGDCYEGGNLFKLVAEYLLDSANRREGRSASAFYRASTGAYALGRLTGGDKNMEGSWYGNDTVWRMSLDLNRVLLYGRGDGTMADVPQRRMVTITDAIICGEGEGPLAPVPHPLGVLTLATNPLAAEFVHAHLMRLDWRKLPIIREGFGKFRYPLCSFRPDEIHVDYRLEEYRQPWPIWNTAAFCAPVGWRGHCEVVTGNSDADRTDRFTHERADPTAFDSTDA